jgi:hypothetical protein
LLLRLYNAGTLHSKRKNPGREIQNPQMFETDPALGPFPQQSTLVFNEIENESSKLKPHKN